MGDIFLSYAREDLPRVKPLVDALEKRGWSVWWDRTIKPGETWDHVIETALDEARCVIVLWSQCSIKSEWVRNEAEEGKRRGILIPALLDDVRVPLAFRRIQAADLVGWSGALPHAGFDDLARAVSIFEHPRQHFDADKPLLRYRFAIEPVLLRAEGITELLGNGYLYCKYDSPVFPANQLWFSVILSFGTQVTSRLNESRSVQTAGEPFMLEVGRPGCDSLIRCTAISGNLVAFDQVHLENMQPFETRVFQIGNIRCNASAVRGFPSDGQLLGAVSVSSATVENDRPIFAIVRKSLDVEVRSPTSDSQVTPVMLRAPTTSTLFPVGILRFTERFANAFKPRIAQGTVRESDKGCAVHTSESFAGPMLRFEGLCEPADFGSRLRALFHNIPAGVQLYVGVEYGSRAVLVESKPRLLCNEVVNAGSIKLRKLHVESGIAEAMWEIVESASYRPATTFDFPVFALLNSDCGGGQIAVNASFAPASTVTSASSTASIPRFIDTSTMMILFGIEH